VDVGRKTSRVTVFEARLRILIFVPARIGKVLLSARRGKVLVLARIGKVLVLARIGEVFLLRTVEKMGLMKARSGIRATNTFVISCYRAATRQFAQRLR
jgi:hypothetical protein